MFFIKWRWTPLLGYMQDIHQFTMGRYMLHILILGELVNGLFFQWFRMKTAGKHMKNYVTFSEAALKSVITIPWEFPEILLFSKISWGLAKFPEISLIFHGKAISLSFIQCVGTLANSGGRYSIYVSDVRGIVAPSPAIYDVTKWSRSPTRIRKWQLCFEQ